jgi:hypothetical protein
MVDPAHCGASAACSGGAVCAQGEVCAAGSCVLTCPAGQLACAGRCVDPSTDRSFCGATASCSGAAAGAICGGGQVCVAGGCQLSCPAGQLACGGKCVDPSSDRAYCGATTCTNGAICPAGEVCSGGGCALSCAAGLATCGASCVDPDVDPLHCGATAACTGGAVCASGQLCAGGTCTVACPAGEIACGASCVDPQTDRGHCGVGPGCTGGAVCAGGQVCSGGLCVLSCPAGQLACAGKCVDPSTDRAYCGATTCGNGTSCGAGQVCSGGSCALSCSPGLAACGTKCVDPSIDPAHCGVTSDCAGGAVCGVGTACSGGVCQVGCPSGQIACSGRCVDPLTDRNFCGAAASCTGGAVCPGGQVCVSGACALSCASGQLACGGKCVDPATDRNYCGATTCADGVACGSGQVCIAGACTTSCPTGLASCGGTCVDPMVDPNHCGVSPTCAGGAVCGAGQYCSGGACVGTTTHAILGGVYWAPQNLITVSLAGPVTRTTAAGAYGMFAFSGLPDGTYTVTPTGPAGIVFEPATAQAVVSGNDVLGVAFRARPMPPTHVAVRPSNGGALVTWSPSPTADGYLVYFGPHGQATWVPNDGSYPVGPDPHLSTTSTSPQYETGTWAAIQGVPNGQRQWFWVTAVWAGNESAPSAQACGVPTASDLGWNGAPLRVYDALCDDRLDASSWSFPGAYSARVANGSAMLAVDAVDLESQYVRAQFQQAAAAVASSVGRVSTLSTTITVPSAGVLRSGAAQQRSVARLLYAPPALRLNYPAQFQDLLAFEVGLVDHGAGLRVFRNVYHCDSGTCGSLSASGISFADPPQFGPLVGLLSGSAASYDTPYRVTVQLDEATGAFQWTISGGEYATPIGGTAIPSAYLAATPSWTGVPLAGAGFQNAQIAARLMDGSATGGGSGRHVAQFDAVWIGTSNGAATPYDDFSGTGTNSGPTELSLSKWTGSPGAPRLLPTGNGAFGIHAELSNQSVAGTANHALLLSNPENVDLLQLDVMRPSLVTTSGTGTVTLQGRFFNDGTGTVPGSALGDVQASLSIGPSDPTALTATISRCGNAACSLTSVLYSANLGGVAWPPDNRLGLRVGFNPYTSEYTFGAQPSNLGTNFDGIVVVPAPAGGQYVAPARAPMKRLLGGVTTGAGTTTTMDLRVNNVLVGVASATPGTCNDLDPTGVGSVVYQYLAGSAPAPLGGTIVPGTYRFATMNFFVGTGTIYPSGTFVSELIRFGSTMDVVWDDGYGVWQRGSALWSTRGPLLEFAEICGSTLGAGFLEYTASATELRLYVTDASSGMVYEEIWTRL